MSTERPVAADVRAALLDPLRMTSEQTSQLQGEACARCGRMDGLSPGGYAYTSSGKGGRLAHPVRVCRDHRSTGGTQ
ncbi:hypothetical protein [Streptomyces sp. NPDC057199]|uniref:hypothetical protein n=1 Tax=Streptomyces sp. NPDC057199 TaxID=3346047 RepID=UPI00364503E7